MYRVLKDGKTLRNFAGETAAVMYAFTAADRAPAGSVVEVWDADGRRLMARRGAGKETEAAR